MGGTPKGTGVAKDSAKLARELSTESKPLRQETLGQTLEALTTGGVGARIPLIQRSVESSNQATSQSMRSLGEGIASTPGLGGTPYAARLQALTQLAGNQATSQIPSQIAGNMAGQAPNMAVQFPQLAQQGLVQSGQLESQLKGQQFNRASLFKPGTKGGSSAF